ncbi:TolC family outer membrane protein [Halomonas sp. TRM85114]|uniref:TolC family outer membrane protein n=1 Tax=Halomonas jincaotanensis TaxID=2810616 RepID=UPI001BD4B20A|nr:TolC family outer membrane protein [Halomonas jincaotanensis]MBS9404502.1 TolC family outer membrane protein [Halomonas jincaotanensis]
MRSPRTKPTVRRFAHRALLPTLVASACAMPLQAADLLTITRDALQNNAELAAARSTFGVVRAGHDIEQADLLPQIGASGNVTHNRQYESQSNGAGSFASGGPGAGDDRYNSASLTLEASQALFDARNRREVERSERQIDQETYRLAATEQQVLIDVAEAYFEILRAYEILEARRAQERAIGRQLEQAREQFEVGLIAITEVEEAQASFDQSRAERIAAESSLQVNFEALERLTSQRYQSIESLQEELPVEPPAPNSRDQWVAMAMENNPLVLAQQAGVEVSRSGVNISQAGRLPTLEAFANYQYSDSDSDVLAGHDSSSQVGLGVNLPLYTGGSTSAEIRQSTFQLESSQYEFEAQRRDTVQQVRSLFTQVSNDVSTVEARAQAIVSNQSALDATRAGYEVGTRNIVDVLNAEQNLFSAIADHAEARYDYVVNLLSLQQQAGTLDVPAIEEINELLEGESVSFTLPGGAGYDEAMEIGEPPSPR